MYVKEKCFYFTDFGSTLTAILNRSASVNFYMFHGGTNFGFMSGANWDFKEITLKTDVTSYGEFLSLWDFQRESHRRWQTCDSHRFSLSLPGLGKLVESKPWFATMWESIKCQIIERCNKTKIVKSESATLRLKIKTKFLRCVNEI